MAALKLHHVVVTSVDRDDHHRDPHPRLPEEEGRRRSRGRGAAGRLQPQPGDRAAPVPGDPPGARCVTSLQLLSWVKELDPSIFTKSGIMAGLGETREEVGQVMDDLRAADVDVMTIGQYLQPTPKHAAVDRFVTPEEFEGYTRLGRAKGFLMVAASPLTRSSYSARRPQGEARRLGGRAGGRGRRATRAAPLLSRTSPTFRRAAGRRHEDQRTDHGFGTADASGDS